MNNTSNNTSRIFASCAETTKTTHAPTASPHAKESPATNLFEVSRQTIWNRYAKHLSGSSVGAFLIVSSEPLTQPAAQALSSTSAVLAYGRANTTFFTLNSTNDAAITTINARTADNVPNANNADTASIDQGSATANATSTPPLSEKDIFRVIESLDPLCLVITDLAAAEQVAKAYRTRIELETPGTILGHPYCCFADFSSMLKNEKFKKKAWSLLKTLPMKEA